MTKALRRELAGCVDTLHLSITLQGTTKRSVRVRPKGSHPQITQQVHGHHSYTPKSIWEYTILRVQIFPVTGTSCSPLHWHQEQDKTPHAAFLTTLPFHARACKGMMNHKPCFACTASFVSGHCTSNLHLVPAYLLCITPLRLPTSLRFSQSPLLNRF